MRIHPASSPLHGEIRLPGDKSISHRYAILGALAQGKTRVSNFAGSQDCQATLNCLQALGVTVHRCGQAVEIHSQGWRHFVAPSDVLDAQNSGTTIRLMSALLASRDFVSTIQGDESLNRRPMKRIITPLTQMGAQIRARRHQYPPLTIQGARLMGIRYVLPVPSAQVKSCVLLAGLMAEGKTTVVEAVPSRDHTERALPFFGARLERDGQELTVTGKGALEGTRMTVPGDFSSAVYFIIAALLVPDSQITLQQVGLNPSRTAVLHLLERAGAWLEKKNLSESKGEPACDLTVRYSPEVFERFPSQIENTLIPNLIDEIPILAILGTRLREGLAVRGAEELRKKESDRIHTVVWNLRNLGIKVQESADGFFIPPGQTSRGGTVRTFGDHRIAMSFAVAGLAGREPVEIDQPECAAVSFPEFFDHLASVTT